jgi:hypothetical protein
MPRLISSVLHSERNRYTFFITSSIGFQLFLPFAGFSLPIFLIMLFPVYGAFRQYRLIEDIKAEVDNYFSEGFAKPTEG